MGPTLKVWGPVWLARLHTQEASPGRDKGKVKMCTAAGWPMQGMGHNNSIFYRSDNSWILLGWFRGQDYFSGYQAIIILSLVIAQL